MIGRTKFVLEKHRPDGGSDEGSTCTARRREFDRRRRRAPACSSARLQSVTEAAQAPAPEGLASVAKSSRRGAARKSACNKGAMPHTRSRSSSNAPVGGMGRRVGSVRAARKATSRQHGASRLKLKAKFQAPRSCCYDVRVTLRTAPVNVTYMRVSCACTSETHVFL